MPDMKDQKKIAVRVKRRGTSSNYEVPADRYSTVLDSLIHIRENLDSTLQFRYSCRMAMCGSCAMKINGKPKLACKTLVSDLGKEIFIEPMDHFGLVRDLVTNLEPFFSKYKSVRPYISGNSLTSEHSPVNMITYPQKGKPEFLESNYCIQCGLCYSACPIVSTDSDFIGPASLNAAYRYSSDFRDQGIRGRSPVVLSHEGLSRCHFAGECTQVCPKGVNPSFSIQRLRKSASKMELKRIFRL